MPNATNNSQFSQKFHSSTALQSQLEDLSSCVAKTTNKQKDTPNVSGIMNMPSQPGITAQRRRKLLSI